MRTSIENVLLCRGVSGQDELAFIPEACIHIDGETIAYAGASVNAPEFGAARVIDGRGALAMPGLVNAHTHIAMTLLRGFGGRLDLHDWLRKKIFPAEERLTADFVRAGARLGMAEMLRFGVTACADMYFFMDSVAEAAVETGMRVSLCRAVMGGADTDGGRLAEAEALARRWHGAEKGRLRVLLGPHAEYTTEPGLIRRIAERAQALGIGIHTHISETRAEVEGCYGRRGASPVRYLAELGLLDLPTLAAHCVAVDEEDIAILAEKNVAVCHNPVSNLKLASGVMPLRRMLEQGVRVCLGTDGASSNNTLNLWEELRLALILHKGVLLDPGAIDEAQGLDMATLIGAQALGYERVGLLAPGWRADLILLDQKAPHHWPVNDPAANLVYSVQGSDVWLTMVDGKICYQDGEWPGLDIEAIISEASKAAEAITRGL